MDDREIIGQLFDRQQTALDAINTKYRNYLLHCDMCVHLHCRSNPNEGQGFFG